LATKPSHPDLDKLRKVDLRPRSVARQWISDTAKAFRQMRRRSRQSHGAEVDKHRIELRACISQKDWQAAAGHALVLGEIAEARNDKILLRKAGRYLRLLGVEPRAWQLLSLAKCFDTQAEWDGGDISNRTLLVERRGGDLGIFFEYASHLALAVATARHCIALVEPRLLPLYRRSFPKLDVRVEGIDEAASHGEADVLASFETLAWHFWANEDQQRQRFAPLKADPAVVEELGANYRTSPSEPLIGFSWGSVNKGKDLPRLSDWRELLVSLPGRIVSMQYGNVEPAVAEIRSWIGDRLIHDPSVDQLVDMDRFAAQVAATDVCLSIDNTAVQTASALAVPSVTIDDDRFASSWRMNSSSIPWYPRTTVIRRRGRPWKVVMEEARKSLAPFVGE
jgi:hypothetical protein